MGQDVETHEFSREDRTRYRDKVRQCLDVFARMLAESSFEESKQLTGLELELNLVDGDANPAMRTAHVLEVIADPAFVTELGQFNIEINVPPRPLNGDGLASFEQQVRESLHAADAPASGAAGHPSRRAGERAGLRGPRRRHADPDRRRRAARHALRLDRAGGRLYE